VPQSKKKKKRRRGAMSSRLERRENQQAPPNADRKKERNFIKEEKKKEGGLLFLMGKKKAGPGGQQGEKALPTKEGTRRETRGREVSKGTGRKGKKSCPGKHALLQHSRRGGGSLTVKSIPGEGEKKTYSKKKIELHWNLNIKKKKPLTIVEEERGGGFAKGDTPGMTWKLKKQPLRGLQEGAKRRTAAC